MPEPQPAHRVAEPATDVRRAGGQQIIPRPPDWNPGPAAPWSHGWTPSLDDLLASLPRHQSPVAPAFPGARPSAVLIVLADVASGPELLLTRRSWSMRSHGGEVSFPGGRLDPGETPLAAALREADEEVGLDPALVTVHGELDHLNTPVSRSYIVPKVATVSGRPHVHARTGEVDRVLWVPVRELTRADTYRAEVWGNRPSDWTLHFFELDDETVWGATARMLFDLLTRSLA
jgi:8-oxo-dGTP pyrophosphatase MutT (NUDIX family)